MKARNFPLVPFSEVKRPIDWSKQFGRSGPLEVEIGSGLGEFLFRLAQRHPERNFVGIEQDKGRIYKILKRLFQSDLRNIRLLNADARLVFEKLLVPLSVDRVHCLFPCPWPKYRHAKHRLLNKDFLRLVNSRLADGGQLRIVTDFLPFAEWVKGELPTSGFCVQQKIIPPQFDTKYERKWKEQGQREFFELNLVKEEHIAIPFQEEVVLKEFHLKSFDPRHFRMRDEKGEITVLFKDYLYDAKAHKAMVRAMVIEEKITQQMWIAIVKTKGGWRIFPAQGCSWIPTPGIRRALELVHQFNGGGS